MANPFLYDRPLPPQDLIDRERELALLTALAESGQSARLMGPRRYGKTTLLGRLAKVMREEHGFAVANVDFSRATSINDVAFRIDAAYSAAFTGKLARAWRSLRRRIDPSATLGVPGIANVGIAPSGRTQDGLAMLHELLEAPRRLYERTGCRCLVSYDEFQEMLAAQPDLDGVLRSHIQHHAGAVSYIFTGSHAGMMDALFGDRRRPLFDQARAVRIGPLPPADIAEYVEARFAKAGRPLEPETADDLARLAAGHPQRAMMLAHFLWEHAHRQPQDITNGEQLDAAWHTALAEAADGLQRTWDSLSANQRKLVKAVAAGHDRPLRKVALEHAGLAKTSAVAARETLAAQGDLFSFGGGRVALSDPFLAAWAQPDDPIAIAYGIRSAGHTTDEAIRQSRGGVEENR
jgi:hypothetical protein